MACAATARLGSRLGLRAGPSEAGCSLNPSDYVYPAPSEAQLQRLLHAAGQASVVGPAGSVGAGRQQATHGLKASGFGAGAALQGAAPSAAAAAAVAAAKALPLAGEAAHHDCSLADDFFGGQLELDDDCLRLLLGDDAAETEGPCASAAGSGKGAACGGGGSGASQKSSATAGEAAGAAASAGDAEAASLPDAGAAAAAAALAAVPFKHDEEDDIAMLFGEYRAEPLDPLHLLGTAHLEVAADDDDDDDDTSSAAGGGGGEAGHCDSPKRAKPHAGASPSAGLHLSLSMDYVKAAESINLELLGAGGAQRKAAACASDGFDAMLPLLSPIMEFGTLSGGVSYADEGEASGDACNSYGMGPAGADTPESPDSLASGSDMTPLPPLDTMERQESTKRKRSVRL